MASQLTLDDLVQVRTYSGNTVLARIVQRADRDPVTGLRGPWLLVEWEEQVTPRWWRPERPATIARCGLWFSEDALGDGLIDLPALHEEYMAAWRARYEEIRAIRRGRPGA